MAKQGRIHLSDGAVGFQIMAKARGVEGKLSRLQALRQEPASAEHVAGLRQALGDKSNLVAAAAAEIAGERVLTELTSDLVAAFDRFLVEPVESDKQCHAKIAIVEALNKIEYDRAELFLRGLHHVQLEPRWGGSVDTAAPLRANAAFGLLRIDYPDVELLLADLLADPERVARCAAAHALGETRTPAAIPLLRFKARIGDEEPEVTGACLAGLLTAAPKESLPFVAQFLDSPNESIQEGAAFALAESRLPGAVDILKDHWPKARCGPLQEVLLLAISMTRVPAALDFLMHILAEESPPTAVDALSALAIHRHNRAVKERVVEVVLRRRDTTLQERFKKKFQSKEPGSIEES